MLDVTEEEADKLLLTRDPLAGMAESDSARIQALLETVRTDNAAVEQLIGRAAGERLWATVHREQFDLAEVPLERTDWRRPFPTIATDMAAAGAQSKTVVS